jgi:formate hydrogenlyase transcriptional activator
MFGFQYRLFLVPLWGEGKDVLTIETLAEETLPSINDGDETSSFAEIVGRSRCLKAALDQAKRVATTDTTVLILGETGTGKELVAKAIHRLSSRRDRTFVRANCASIPAGLVESELFGHEKGAFTGAVGREIGRFELAHKGTLFLDEVGDVPLEFQPKLLHVLQEQEFERLGSPRTLHVNFRLLTATNRDLSSMVESHQFRSDLYYRLSVFPIELPALRDRPEDIPLLTRHFAQKYAQRMDKKIESIRRTDLNALVCYPWPGNVRELQNVVERSVILSSDRILQLVPIKRVPNSTPHEPATLATAERNHILQALRQTNWVVGGLHGAAELLGLKRTTLVEKMRRLGMSRPRE